MSARIPPLIEGYLALPAEPSLNVVTNVLGASSNWLVLRYLYSILRRQNEPDHPSAHVRLVLVSFLRDFEFWREGCGKLGLDLEALARQGRFAFLQGLGIALPPDARSTTTAETTTNNAVTHGATTQLRSQPHHVLATVEKEIADAIGDGSKVVLLIDQLDLLLAMAGDEDNSAYRIQQMVASFGQKAHTTILTLAADDPLLAAQNTQLEKEHAALILSLAHEARWVMSLRMLDTGAASDVSGVLRFSRGGDDVEDSMAEHEYLYFVAGDGNVRVFERGQ